MYTGTLINDLISMVDRAELRADEKRMAEELHEIFTMQVPVAQGDQAFMGAA
jgi:hypothetical protein